VTVTRERNGASASGVGVGPHAENKMTRNIPRDEWCSELDSFSRQHEGWIVNVEVSGSDGTRQTEARELPLVGVSCDAPTRDRVDIMVGDRPGSHVTHIVKPIDVALETTDAGAERGLRIRAADGSTTTVEFRSPMRAVDVDGIPSPSR